MNKLYKWNQDWKIKFNAKSYHVVEMRVKRPSKEYRMGNEKINKAKEAKDCE